MGFEGLEIATTRDILRWRKQKQKKPRHQDFKKAQAWMISSGHKESGPKLYPVLYFGWWPASSADVKSPKTLTGVAVHVLQRSDTSFDTSRVDSRSAPSVPSPQSLRW